MATRFCVFAVLLLVASAWAQDPYAQERAAHYAKVHARKRGVSKNVRDRVRSFLDVVPKPLFEILEKEAYVIGEYEKKQGSLRNDKKHTRWLQLHGVDVKPKTAIEEIILRLRKLVDTEEHIEGAEWWFQIVRSGDPIGFHVDKDESVASNKMYLKHPIWASVFYVTDIGGGTLLPNQWSPWGNGYDPVKPEEGEFVLPRKNKYMLFDGTLLHGVVPGEPFPGDRVTFLVNWWSEKPEAPNCLPLDHSAVPNLKIYSEAEMAELRKRVAEWEASPEATTIREDEIIHVDLTKKSKTPSRKYTFRLPGGGSETVRLPLNVEPGRTYSMLWKRPKGQRAAAAAKVIPVTGEEEETEEAEEEEDTAPKRRRRKSRRRKAKVAKGKVGKKGRKSKRVEEEEEVDADDDWDVEDELENYLRRPKSRRERRREGRKRRQRRSKEEL